jgi:N-carbamoylputrescine amidase
MRVTVCQLDCERDFEAQWAALCAHTRLMGSELVLLPEMPFAPWLPGTRDVDPAAWDDAVAAHERWLPRLGELGAGVVLTTVPISSDAGRFNQAVVWASGTLAGAHVKTYLPDEPGFWEASWYHRGPTTFDPVDTPGGRVGFLVCSELWFLEHARAYGHTGVDLVACPRATDATNVDKWLAAGRVAAICAGAFCLSSNRVGVGGEAELGGRGWVADPDGELLARTNAASPFATVDIDLEAARRAKKTYPRYVDDRPVSP